MTTVSHLFVDSIPKSLEQRTVYVCLEYDLVVHLCLCGCTTKVVTPLGPAEWSLVQEDNTISLRPSVGNGALPCRSHYWIIRGEAHWLPQISARQHAAAAERDDRDLTAFLARENAWLRRLFGPVRRTVQRWWGRP